MKRAFSNLVRDSAKSELHRSAVMTPFSQVEPFQLKVNADEYKHFKLAVYHEASKKNAKALMFFLPDFGVSAKNFGSLFTQICASENVRAYSFDRRGFGWS